MAWLKIYNFLNLIRQSAPRNATTSDGYLPFGAKDDWPIEWSRIISESPTGKSCLSTTQDFIEGDGFSGNELEDIKVNPSGETFWQIHAKCADSFGEFEGFALLIRYNVSGAVTEVEFLPFENCRLGKPDYNGFISKIYYNPFFGTVDYNSTDKKQTIIYDVFNPNSVKDQILRDKTKYKGQVLFVGTTTTLSRFYPKHEAVSGKKWMKTETSVADYHEDNMANGMLQPFMLIVKGNPFDPSNNPEFADYNGDGKPATASQEFDEIVSHNFMGAKRIGNMWVQWVNNNEEAPTVLTLPANNNGDLFNNLDTHSTKKITLAWKVPSILANINEGASLGGDGNLIRVSVKLMQQRVKRKQRYLTEAYKKFLPLMVTPYKEEVVITPYNPYPELEILDDKIWDALTPDEKREWITKNTDIILLDGDLAEPKTEPQISNAIQVTFPDNVVKTINKALEYADKMGLKCGGKAGREVAAAIVANKSMGLRQLKRVYSYLKRNERFANSPFNEGCDVILYNQWGGKPMFDFLDVKLKDFDAWLN